MAEVQAHCFNWAEHLSSLFNLNRDHFKVVSNQAIKTLLCKCFSWQFKQTVFTLGKEPNKLEAPESSNHSRDGGQKLRTERARMGRQGGGGPTPGGWELGVVLAVRPRCQRGHCGS